MTPCIPKIFLGGLRPLPPEGILSGIVKEALTGPVTLGPEGLAGDQQGDRQHHGGPEKALHLYPAEHYARLATHRPALAAGMGPGALGENLSTTGWNEATVCVGDIFRLGRCLIQVSQPRQPCWKINRRLGEEGLARYIAEGGITGWYFRVLEGGMLHPGDRFELVERPAPTVSLARLWQASHALNPDPAEIAALLTTPGLSPNWIRKLAPRPGGRRVGSIDSPP